MSKEFIYNLGCLMCQKWQSPIDEEPCNSCIDHDKRVLNIPTPCQYCGKLCDLAYTTDDCCDCFNKSPYTNMHSSCPTCDKRTEHEQWVKDHTTPITEFIV